MRRAFLMMSDVLIAYLIVAWLLILVNYIPKSPKYNYVYLQQITNDVATLIEYSPEEIGTIINLTPDNTCFRVEYGNNVFVKDDCPINWNGQSAVSLKTYNNTIIIVKGWYKWLGG